MAFAYTTERRTVIGNMRMVGGTFTGSGATAGGDISTGLNRVEFFSIQETGSSVQANKSVVNETFPCGGDVTIVTDAAADGVWLAIGR